MNQNDFRALLDARGSGSNDSGGKQVYGGKRNISESDLDEIRKLSKKPKKKGKKPSQKEQSEDNRSSKKDDSASMYRDRAAERRQGLSTDMINADEYAHFDAEQTKFLGGDMEHTHLVKGLDFALLAQLKREKEKLLQATTIRKEHIQEKEKQPSSEKLAFKSRVGRLVYFHAVQSNTMSSMLQHAGAQRKSEHFLPGRMYYTFALKSTEVESTPVIVQRSKEDCPEVDELVSGIVDELVIARVGDAVSSKRFGTKKLRKKKKSREDGESAYVEGEEDTEADAASSSSVGTQQRGVVADEDDEDEDIFPDVGEYVPIDQRADEEQEAKRVTHLEADNKAPGYFSNLSASISAAERAERQKEHDAEQAWKQTIRKVVETQSQAERERKEQERKLKEAKAGVDEYSECYPEYQAAAALDSEDDEEARPRKGVDKDDKDDVTTDGAAATERSRRKKQKQGNKLQSDLEKINKVRQRCAWSAIACTSTTNDRGWSRFWIADH